MSKLSSKKSTFHCFYIETKTMEISEWLEKAYVYVDQQLIFVKSQENDKRQS